MKDGNKQNFAGEAGVGIISSRAIIEGPIIKDKASFIVSARRTYADLLIKPFLPTDVKGGYFFYDLNIKANWEINPKNRIYLSGYFGKDKFFGGEKYSGKESEAGLFWDNATSTIRWNSVITDKLFSNLSLIFSNYRLKIYASEKHQSEKYEMSYRSGIRDCGLKYDFTWLPLPSHTIRYGLSSVWHSFNPSAVVLKDDQLSEYISKVETINTIESGLYIEDEIKMWDKGIVNIGSRLSHFVHEKSSNINLEPRISGSYFLTDVLSAKASFAQMNQYMHLISTTGIGLPTDLWVPATNEAPWQESWQAALGLTRDLNKYSTTFSIEGYYKESKNVIAYKEGASFLLLNDPTEANEVKWEDNITSGFGKSYGVEFLAHRRSGKLSGWIGYTLSWTKLQFDELNQGKEFYARYDRRHDISVVAVYELSKGITLSGTWVYGTGNAITLPLATYFAEENSPGFNNHYVWYRNMQDYGEKNSFRMAPYHRLDLGVQVHKKFEKYERTWEFSVYNAYNRHNPFFYYITEEYNWDANQQETYQNKLKQVSIFPFIPSVSWSIKF
ncbi:MAG TPA: hypothetical protein PLE67_02230 [Tenuifilaceae bacterium]|nr:hypothetical protein [Tenuifilaceae bacterium]HPQ32885.1 hypothetical protein [Tenuifilaceae bacterium]